MEHLITDSPKRKSWRVAGALALLSLGLGFGSGSRGARAASAHVPLESLMVSNVVRLSAGHPGQWKSKTFRRGIQIQVQQFATCNCDTALFALRKHFGTVSGQIYVDKASSLGAGQVALLSATDFTQSSTYVSLWSQNRLSRDRPTKFRVRVRGVTYLLLRVTGQSCCLTVDVLARADRSGTS